MARTEVYRWRISPELKAKLEEAARSERKSVEELLEEIVQSWLEQSEQKRMRASALTFTGAVEGGDPERSSQAREHLRDRLASRIVPDR